MSADLDRDLDLARRELLQHAHVVAMWRRRGGGVVSGATVLVAWPGADPAPVSDADLAALRTMQLQGSVTVTWPFNATLGSPGAASSAPLAPQIEAAAVALAKSQQPRGGAP